MARMVAGSKEVPLESDFILHNEIQRGRFGVVKKAELRATGQMFAVKTITKSEIPQSHKHVLQSEIDVLKQMDHPNTLNCHDTYEDTRYLHVVSDLCTGGELFERIIEKEEGFSEADSAEIMQQVLSGLAYMHSNDIVHRDVKPENLLYLSPDADADLVHIDFGMAKVIPPNEKSYDQVGSLTYCAPETIRDHGRPGHDRSCDIWSAGVVLYILLCGYPPFYGDTDAETRDMILSGAVSFDEPEWQPVSAGAKDLIRRMLHFQPSSRPTAEECLNDSWTANHARNLTDPLPRSVLKSISSFRSHENMKKRVLNVIAENLSADEIGDLRQTFERLDTEGKGYVTMEALKGVLDSRVDAQSLQELDSNHDGNVDFNEFLAGSMRRSMYLQEEKMYQAFQKLDLDGNNRLSADEIAQVIGNSAEAAATMKELDLDGNGEIDFQEFLIMMRRY